MTLFKKAPPCPDPDLFVLVQGRNGSFWRRKRGSVKPATLNPSLQQNSKAIAHCSPLAKRVAGKLAVFTRGMDTERLQPRLTAAFMKWLKNHEGVSLAALADFEFQPSGRWNGWRRRCTGRCGTACRRELPLSPFRVVCRP